MADTPLYRYASIGSTNTEAMRLLARGAEPPFWVVAEEQTAGRGRRGRAWLSLPGNLYASYAVRSARPAHERPSLSLVAALAVAEAVEAIVKGRASVSLKWPNDVLLNGGKLSGILLESAGTDAIAIGIGVNVAAAPKEGTLYRTAALSDIAMVEANEVRQEIDAAFSRLLSRYERHGFAALRKDWIAHATGLSEPVTVRLEREEALSGIFEDIDEMGCLLLRLKDGTLKPVLAGDVFPLADAAHQGSNA